MKSAAFIDTNIFLYADDSSTPAKQDRAISLIKDLQRTGRAVISLQVMQEYFAAATGKLGVSAETAQRKVELMARFRVVRPKESDIVAAIELHRLYRTPFWDAMILHAARIGGAETLYSEDLQHGYRLGDLRVANPFIG
jgi:predicted nucleic acid-binding protein